MMIEIINEVEGEFPANYDKLLKEAVLKTLEYEKINVDLEICISIVGKERIKELNRDFRNIDKATDVLSFPSFDFPDGADKNEVILSDVHNLQMPYLGDVVLCFDVAKKQAYDYGHSLERELAFLTVHSVLHLLGYDHMEEEEEMEMRQKQRDIISLLS